MATKFIEPGGDADFAIGFGTPGNGFWSDNNNATVVTDFVHGSHIKSLKYAPNTGQAVISPTGILADAGRRITMYIYLNALPTTAAASLFGVNAAGGAICLVRLTTAGTLQLWNSTTAQVGTDGATLSTGIWYRLCLSYTITNGTTNRFVLFKDTVQTISVTNGTFDTPTGSNRVKIGNTDSNAGLDFRSSDHYVDDSSALTDTGDVWVTAKRPFANGTTNGFTTQVGAGGSGYGTGHAPQVNERPLSTSNGWSMIGAGSAVIEEYNIESVSVGDMNLTGKTLVDYAGWVSINSLAGETINVILDGASLAQAITSSATVYTKFKGSTTYPAGTGTDLGVQTDTSLTTVTLNECGVLVAFIGPPTTTTANNNNLLILGIG